MSGIPSNYAGATRPDADANACLSLTRTIWIRLKRESPTQAAAILDASKVHGGRVISIYTPARTARALVSGFLVEDGDHACGRLTGLGVMVREAGVYTREPSP